MSGEHEVVAAARALASAGLVDAFGHVSARSGAVALMTPPRPLAELTSDDALLPLPLDGQTLRDGAPKEGWIHLCVYESRRDVAAICRAQPAAVAAAAASGISIRALHGQGAFAGRVVPVFDEARLVRTRELGEGLAAALGASPALVMRGNGALTVAESPGRAAALMFVLERSARLNLAAAASGGGARELTDGEFDAWQSISGEILDRLWAYLRDRPPHMTDPLG